jgi:hypothetical protein
MSRPIVHLAFLALAAMLPGAAWAAEDVHAVDFRNFVYQPSCADFEAQEEAKVPVRVTCGRFEAAVDDYIVTCRTTEWSGVLPGYGIYRFSVLATRGSASYEMTVGIR